MVVDGVNGMREVPASEFFLGDLTTVIEAGEFLREARFPICDPGAFSSFYEVSVRQEGVALVGLAAYLVREHGQFTKAVFAAMGVDAVPMRLRLSEAKVLGRELGKSDIEEIGEIASGEVDPMPDLYATAAYRKHVIGSLVQKALHAVNEVAT
jgi:carbon-monoxide dehydrogenase medium subunit